MRRGRSLIVRRRLYLPSPRAVSTLEDFRVRVVSVVIQDDFPGTTAGLAVGGHLDALSASLQCCSLQGSQNHLSSSEEPHWSASTIFSQPSQ